VSLQAACNHKYRFVGVAVVAPGGCKNVCAYWMSTLAPLIADIPIVKYVIGDNAYRCLKHILTPLSGSQ
jgi:hypothetical protein